MGLAKAPSKVGFGSAVLRHWLPASGQFSWLEFSALEVMEQVSAA
jgi:hypothetical protein